jgi:L-2-hydroxyglutarate oxidase LhgO
VDLGIERIGVIGAGIVGLAVARRLGQVYQGAQITVVDKETSVGTHQTGHNSGVVHAGIYYAPDSLKATLCTRGSALLREYCQDRGIAFQVCGKLVVAIDQGEVGALRRIEERATKNQVPELRRVDAAKIREIEPHAVGVAALHSPRTAITDYPAIARAYADDVIAASGRILLGQAVESIVRVAGQVRVRVGQQELEFDRLVICAGLQSDLVAEQAGDDPEPAIVPFRGEYYRLVESRRYLVNGLIYPIPDPHYPFLGIHFTRRIDGGVEVGPNAVLALAREGYLRRNVAPREVWSMLRWPGFQKLARAHWKMGLSEMVGSASTTQYLKRAQAYVPELRADDVVRAGAGVRAQAVDRDGSLVDDFRIHRLGPVLAVRNAPSPAATSSLAIAEYVCEQFGGD